MAPQSLKAPDLVVGSLRHLPAVPALSSGGFGVNLDTVRGIGPVLVGVPTVWSLPPGASGNSSRRILLTLRELRRCLQSCA